MSEGVYSGRFLGRGLRSYFGGFGENLEVYHRGETRLMAGICVRGATLEQRVRVRAARYRGDRHHDRLHVSAAEIAKSLSTCIMRTCQNCFLREIRRLRQYSVIAVTTTKRRRYVKFFVFSFFFPSYSLDVTYLNSGRSVDDRLLCCRSMRYAVVTTRSCRKTSICG